MYLHQNIPFSESSENNIYDMTVSDYFPIAENILYYAIGNIYNFPLFVENTALNSVRQNWQNDNSQIEGEEKKDLSNDLNNIHIEGDSLLVISQVSKKWKIRSDSLLPLFSEVEELLKSFSHISLKHILRGLNAYADKLCDKILKNKKFV